MSFSGYSYPIWSGEGHGGKSAISMLYPWQKNVVESFITSSSKQKMWLYDDGGTGKTYLARHLCDAYGWKNLPLNYIFTKKYVESPGYIIHLEETTGCEELTRLLQTDANFLILANNVPSILLDDIVVKHTSDI